MGFRKAAELIRKSGGSYIGGRWVDGAETRTPITVSVQHREAGGSQDRRDPLPEDERAESSVTLYTSTELRPGGRPGVEADLVAVSGKVYEIKTVEPWQNGLISHYKATAAEVIA